jgi:tetratricopeptide (TPR) repeat protein
MSNPGLVNEAFRHLQSGQAERALDAARAVAEAHPTLARARLAEAIALRMLGRVGEASAALKSAAALDPRDHGVAYEAGVVHQMQGDRDGALAEFERARALKPSFFAAHFSAGSLRLDAKDWNGAAERFRAALAVQPAQIDALTNLVRALKGAGRLDEADAAFIHALAANPHDPNVARAFGQHSVSRGNYKRAATLFADAWRGLPDDENLPIFLTQVELMLGHWDSAWAAYSKRAPRGHFERSLVTLGAKYQLHPFASLKGRDVSLVAEQGLGDILFFLRWAPLAAKAGARLHFIGPPQLHTMLGRTGLFASFHAFGDASAPATLPLMIGDLPQIAGGDPSAQPGLSIAPLPDRLAAWRKRLEAAGPRPWIGVTWRAGTPHDELTRGLYKTVPQPAFFEAVGALDGTVVALQRKPEAGELAAATKMLGRTLHDFTRMNDDLEDALALVALLDRHIGVSNTNMHLADAAGKTADVLVPFPPEWRWRIEGESPWFPGFRVHRQTIDGDWSTAINGVRLQLS